MCKGYILQEIRKKKNTLQPRTLQISSSWIPFVSAIAICPAQTTGSAPQFNKSCIGERLQRTAGALFPQDGTFTKKKKVLCFKTSSKMERVWYSLYSVSSHVKGARPVPANPAVLLRHSSAAAATITACLRFLLLFLHSFSIVGIFLFSNVMTFLCYSFWHIRCKRYWTRLILHSFLQIKRLLNYLELSLCQHIRSRAILSFSLVS